MTVRIPVGDGFEDVVLEPDVYDSMAAEALVRDCTIADLICMTIHAWAEAGWPDPRKPWGTE